MSDYIKREDAIDIIRTMMIVRPLDSDRYILSDVADRIRNIPSAEPKVDKDYLIELIQGAVYDGEDCARLMKMVESKPVLTEEVREAIMRLTMCARHECAMCKLSNNEDDCYEIATKRMNILADAFDKPKQGEWIPCSERLPEEHEWIGTKTFGTTISDEVYVTFESPKGERFTKHLSFQNGKVPSFKQREIDVLYKGSVPIAWRPLPEPWEGA